MREVKWSLDQECRVEVLGLTPLGYLKVRLLRAPGNGTTIVRQERLVDVPEGAVDKPRRQPVPAPPPPQTPPPMVDWREVFRRELGD